MASVLQVATIKDSGGNANAIEIANSSANVTVNNLAAGVLDFSWSGADIFFESEPNIQSKISIFKKYDWGKSSLVVAAPNHWVDLANVTDLEEISWIFLTLP